MVGHVGDALTRLCTICARGGSKGVSGKNVRLIGGRPLLAWSIAQARDSGLFAAIVVSSDSDEILDAATRHGADLALRRPDALATDAAPKLPAILHALNEGSVALGLDPSVLVDLDATSPLRLPSDIAGAVAMLESTQAPCVITGSKARRSPYFNLVEERADGTICLSKTPSASVERRQDVPKAYDMNASIYVWRVPAFRNDPRIFYPDLRLFEMPEHRSIDIDSELDFRIVQMLLDERMAGGAA